MTTRIDNAPELSTDALLSRLIMGWLNDERVMFLVPRGEAYRYMQRIRTMMSRNRKRQERDGKKRMYFTIHHTTHAHTENGLRYDAIVTWRTQTEDHRRIEALEDMIGHGGII